ncbi:MAG: SpoIIE family protein phosphatase [Clostridia bacterium]|nr:SpoIIE family protein phosphatase [Clostridia bacterium]
MEELHLKRAYAQNIAIADIAFHVSFFIVTLLFGMIGGQYLMPFGAGMVLALWLMPKSRFAITATFAGIAGGIVGGSLFIASSIALASALCICLALIKKGLSRLDRILMFCGAQLLMIPLFSSSTEDMLHSILCAIISTACGPLLCNGLQGLLLSYRRASVSESARLGIAALAMLFCASFGMLNIANIRIGVIIACYVLLCFLICKSMPATIAIALSIGRIIGGDSSMLSVSLCFTAFVCMLISGYGKLMLSIGYIACTIAISVFLPLDGITSIAESVIAALLFMLTPKGLIARFIPKRQGLSQAETELIRIKRSLKQCSLAVADMADAFTAGDSFAHGQLMSISNLMDRITSPLEAETPIINISVGKACVPKAGMKRSGDSMEIFEHEALHIMLMGDGMGSGYEARNESRRALIKLSELIKAGFAPKEAITSINRLLIANGTGDMYTTLDMLVLNRSCGKATFIKLGAPPSFIIRKGKIHTVYAEALPAGILPQAKPFVQDVYLKPGDSVIMMTDGITEALGSELIATLLEKVCCANTAEDAAIALVQSAMHDKGRIDDMSVLVGRIT